jgi:gamma-glutamyltranspeptidase/glutathione hydrolase
MALEKYGTKARAEVLRPAIDLAEKGFAVHDGLRKDIADKQTLFAHFPSTMKLYAADRFAPDTTFWQPELAATLKRIADDGAQGFYAGRTADLIVAEMRRSGGIITYQDLLAYRAAERAPLIGTYRGDTIISMPPPSSGGVLLIHMLAMLEPYRFDTIPYHSAAHIHLLAEVMRRAYADRAQHLGDPDFWKVPTAGLMSREYARVRAATIAPRATPSDSVDHGDPAAVRPESPQTTHYSVADREGNCVSVTVTLNASFGSKLVVDGAGFFLNNEMDDFAARPGAPNMYGLLGSDANAIVPGKRMLSSMTPTIVVRGGRPWLVVGTPGGSTIITTVLQTIQNQIDYRMSIDSAVESPRVHHQWRPDTIFYEKGGINAATADTLRGLGYSLVERGETSGRVDAIRIERDSTGRTYYLGWSDGRGYGRAGGP